MSTAVTWPGGGTGAIAASYNIPAAGELNWAALSNFLVAIAQGAQATTFQKFANRVALTTPVTVAVTDCIVGTKLSSPGAVAVTLPAGANKQVFFIFDNTGDAQTNNITITPNGAETINGAATLVLNRNYAWCCLAYNQSTTDWKIVAQGAPFTSIIPGDLPTIPINKGGTGQTTQTAGFDALSPMSAKGDLIVFSTVGTRLPVGTDGFGLIADAAQTVGVKWAAVLTNPMTNAGDIIYGGVSGTPTRLAAGTTSQVLVGGASAPSWGNVPVAALPVATSAAYGAVRTFVPAVLVSVNNVSSADYTILDGDGYSAISFTTGNSQRTCTLPNVANNAGRILLIEKIDSGTGTVLIDTPSTETINGAAQNVLNAQYSYVVLQSNGTNWIVRATWDLISIPFSPGLSSSGAYNSSSASIPAGTWNGTIATTLTATATTFTSTLFDFGISSNSGSYDTRFRGGLFATNVGTSWLTGSGQTVNLSGGTRIITQTSATTWYAIWQVTYSVATGGGGGWSGRADFTRVV